MRETTVELVLEGLDCAVCAAKINDKVNKLENVKEASLNFASKILTIELSSEDAKKQVVDGTKKIVSKLEPDVIVSERDHEKITKKVLKLEGLDCANCAIKIESRIKELDGVKSASVDFTTGKLNLESNTKDLYRIIEAAKLVIKKIEPDVTIHDESEKVEQEDGHKHVAGESKTQLIKLGLSGLIFGTALAFKLPNQWEFMLFLAAYLLAGGEVVLRAVKDIKNGQLFDESFLMSIATIGAFAIGEYPEGVAVMLFYQVGEFFQDLAVNRSRKSIADLMDIRPDYANLKVGNELRTVSPEDVKIGEFIVVKPGEKVPLDGTIVEGMSMVDTSALTGESVPREVEAGSEVYGGFINKNGLLTIEVKKEFGESTVSKILELVENASSKKAPTEQFITKFARVYTPFVVAAALALAVIPPLVIDGATFSDWIYRALVFLVISCPCALVISIPLGFFGGIGGASKNGILIKGGNYLEALNNVDTVVFDKTGTLTKGVFIVTEINPVDGISEEELLENAAYAENYSNHPIALSIMKAYGKEIDTTVISGHEEIPGLGLRVNIKGREILAGNAKLMTEKVIAFDMNGDVGTIVYIAVDGKYAGSIVISDEIKQDSEKLVAGLKEIGVRRTVMLTGDNKKVGDKIGKQLGLDLVYSELLPDQKVEKLELIYKEKTTKGRIVFVGDGINDAPVLARADVGVAMGGLGSDAAIEAADVVLMTDEPSKLISAIKISKRTRRIVLQNIALALVVKGIVLILGAGGLATMWEAVFADVGVAIIAVLNAMRVMNTKNL
ncbi:cadmium-translocating P-type ATPase [Proteiniclasticum sp. BAD-10]|uniref:Cd(2+)-exporting ATPase n=1 Tax=Proteiniclasticum sediminis TaxID=2804028 RepID=A0A941CTS7_9CLOT|nr:heavy metal translocating P-type ATPase [Proteiniclasticum sediminis]MBR0577429.1 cadmium-translocating P-type ATPase [Proteiniclasticum sediminis]